MCSICHVHPSVSHYQLVDLRYLTRPTPSKLKRQNRVICEIHQHPPPARDTPLITRVLLLTLATEPIRPIQHTLHRPSRNTNQPRALDIQDLALVVVRKRQHVLKLEAVQRARAELLRRLGQAEDAGAAMRGGDDEDAQLGNLRSVAVAVVRAGDEREGALALVGVQGLADGDDGFDMIADVVERSLIEVYVFFRYYQEWRCDVRL